MRQAVARKRPQPCTACAARASGRSFAARAPNRCSKALRAELSRPRRVLDARVRAEREALTEQARLARERLPDARACPRRTGRTPSGGACARGGGREACAFLARRRAGTRAGGRRSARPPRSALIADDARAGARSGGACAGRGARQRRRPHRRDPRELVRELPVVRRRSCSRSPGSGRHSRRLRLRPAARRALVRGRDRRGRLARARSTPPRARR